MLRGNLFTVYVWVDDKAKRGAVVSQDGFRRIFACLVLHKCLKLKAGSATSYRQSTKVTKLYLAY